MNVKIGTKVIGDHNPTFIIAEAGSNHNGNLNMAKELIDAAKEVGADAVKFQSFKPETIMNKKNEQVFSILSQYQLPREWHKELIEYANKKEILFLSTPFDMQAINLLEEHNVPAYKIASGDLTYVQLIESAARTKKPLIMSTGAAYLKDVELAVKIAQDAGNDQIILLHCTVNYPTKFENVHLKSMVTIGNTFQLPFGYSDHTLGITVPLAAVAMGASVIEKHFTLDRTLEGPDHPHSLEVNEFKHMVEEIRNLELSLGSPIKKPTPTELEGPIIRSRRSIYAKINLKPGDILTEEQVVIVRPNNGLAPVYLKDILNKTVTKEIKAYDPITWDKLS